MFPRTLKTTISTTGILPIFLIEFPNYKNTVEWVQLSCKLLKTSSGLHGGEWKLDWWARNALSRLHWKEHTRGCPSWGWVRPTKSSKEKTKPSMACTTCTTLEIIQGFTEPQSCHGQFCHDAAPYTQAKPTFLHLCLAWLLHGLSQWPQRLKVWLAHPLSEYFFNERINDA